MLEAAGLSERCDVQGGNFFQRAPEDADVYMLGHIIHDWDDSNAGVILANLRRVMASGARLLVVEYVIPDVAPNPPGDGAPLGEWLDLHMMVAAGGLERTEAQYRQLFVDHGFRLTRVVPTDGGISVIEGVPA
jgi:hypothetical protein